MDSLKFVCAWKGSAIPGAKIAVKVMILQCTVYNTVLMNAMSSVQIGGLQLEGCSFDGSRLIENQRDSPSVSTVPSCTVAWVAKETPPPYLEGQCISMPVYYSANREKLVTCLYVPLPGGGGAGSGVKWIRCGAAMFLKN